MAAASTGKISRQFALPLLTAGLLLGSPLLAQVAAPASAPRPDPWPGFKKVLAIGETSTAFQHDSISHALATIERLGRESGLYMTIIRTDTQLVTKAPVRNGETPVLNAKNLDFFDAIFFFGAGPGTLDEQQMADLLSFVRDDGKGFVAAHTGVNAFQGHPGYRDMIGGLWDHPWTKAERLEVDLPIVVEDPQFPAMQGLPATFSVHDEAAVHQAPYSRDNVRVLASVDLDQLDPELGRSPATDRDVPIAWAREYGKGRVFYSVLGHSDQSWDDPLVQQLFLNALRWSLGLVEGDATPLGEPAGR
ncbi:MAG: ThuA domain-containing protein [Pseudohongiellaceae bacterium]